MVTKYSGRNGKSKKYNSWIEINTPILKENLLPSLSGSENSGTFTLFAAQLLTIFGFGKV